MVGCVGWFWYYDAYTGWVQLQLKGDSQHQVIPNHWWLVGYIGNGWAASIHWLKSAYLILFIMVVWCGWAVGTFVALVNSDGESQLQNTAVLLGMAVLQPELWLKEPTNIIVQLDLDVSKLWSHNNNNNNKTISKPFKPFQTHFIPGALNHPPFMGFPPTPPWPTQWLGYASPLRNWFMDVNGDSARNPGTGSWL